MSNAAQVAERSAEIARILETESDLKAFQQHLEEVLCGEAFRGVMHREDVDLIDTNEPIHDSIRRPNDFTYDGIFELRYGSAGFRELDQAIRGRDETGNNDRGVVGRILTDERLNGS